MITKEQEEELMKKIDHNQKHEEYVCEDCNQRLIGLDAVSKHVSEFHHYSLENKDKGVNQKRFSKLD